MRIATVASVLSASLIFLAGCSEKPRLPEPIGEAWVGPAQLNLRKEIAPRSGVAAEVKHGERLDIVRVRRSFVLVRTAGGVEGWTDSRQLLNAEEVAELLKLEQDAKFLPSQGLAATHDLLNVHTTPDRRSPSFLQVREGEKFDVLMQRMTPRLSTKLQKRRLLPEPAPAPPRVRKTKEPKYPKPPMPPVPGPPEDWLELSKTPPDPDPVDSEKAVPMDDWYLVRNSAGRSGWVLANRVYLAIPDEVAQYAEGKRITSYLALGEVKAGDQSKSHWVWTTIEHGLQPYQFDGLRVFVWSLRRGRYETAYRERNLKGYYPILPEQVELSSGTGRRGAVATARYPGFSVLVEKADGLRYRRRYAFLGNIVRFSGETPEESDGDNNQASRSANPAAPAVSGPSVGQRIRDGMGALRKKVLGQ